TKAANGAQPPQSDPSDAIMKRIDRILVRPANDQGDSAPSRESLYGKVAAQLVVQTAERGESLVESIRQFVDAPELRIDGAWQHATLAVDLLQEMRQRLTAQAARWRGTEAALNPVAEPAGQPGNSGLFGWSAWPKAPEDRRHQFLVGYARNRLFALLSHAVRNQDLSTESKLVALVDQLNCLSQRLVLLAKPFVSAAEETGTGNGGPATGD